MTLTEQLADFRDRWLEAKRVGNVKQMKIIEIRAALLKKNIPLPKAEQEVSEAFGMDKDYYLKNSR